MAVALGVCLTLRLTAQEDGGFKIELDPSIRPESVHVQYYLVGEFGGYGDFTDRPRAIAGEISLPIYRDFQRANSVKAVVYAKGCEIATFAADLLRDLSRARFECYRLPTVWLRGRVSGAPRASDLTVRLQYAARWSHVFFGIADGAVSSFAIAAAPTDRDGRFAVEVPDFANDSVTNSYPGQAEWSVTARKTGTNDQYWLNVEKQANRFPGALAIEREYPKELQFIAQKL